MNKAEIFKPSEPVKKGTSRPSTTEGPGYARSNPGVHRATISLSHISPGKTPIHKDDCHICKCFFSLMNKKLVCKGCGEAMCYIHSALLDKYNFERICDTCMHEILSKQAEEEIAEIKQKYSGELSFSVLEREEKTRLINKALGRLRKLKSESKEKIILFNNEEDKAYKELEDATDEVTAIQEEIEHYKYLVECQKAQERLANERVLMAGEDNFAHLGKMIQAKNLYENYQNELQLTKEQAFSSLSVAKIKNIICLICNNALAEKYPAQFELIQAPHKPENDKIQDISKHVCKCNLF